MLGTGRPASPVHYGKTARALSEFTDKTKDSSPRVTLPPAGGCGPGSGGSTLWPGWGHPGHGGGAGGPSHLVKRTMCFTARGGEPHHDFGLGALRSAWRPEVLGSARPGFKLPPLPWLCHVTLGTSPSVKCR